MRHTSTVLRCLALCVLVLALGSGCFGKCVVTQSVTKWHAGIKTDKYTKEAIFLPVFLLALPTTALVDYFIVNAIDYWSADGDPLEAAFEPTDGAPSHSIAASDAAQTPCRMVMEPRRAVLEDESGRAIAELDRQDDGSLLLTDLRSGSERLLPPDEVATLQLR
jgi:hypothetical protein